MAERDEAQLLDALSVALRPDPGVEPSVSELMALQVVVSDVRAGSSAPGRGVRRLRTWTAGLLAGGVVLSGGTAYATSGAAPRPVRSAAFALKLPVEAPDLTDAKDALDDLEGELREGRRDKVAAALADVDEELADLTASARSALDPRAATLLATARTFLADPIVDRGSSGGGSGSDERGGDDSGGTGSSGSGSSGSGSSGSGDSGDDDSSGSGSGDSGDDDSSGSGSGTGGSGSGDSGDDDSSGSGSGSGSGTSGSDDGGSSGGGGDSSDDDGISASSSGRSAGDGLAPEPVDD